MSYGDFLSSLGSVITSFMQWLGTMAGIVSGNFILMTLLGLSLFAFVFYFFVDLLLGLKDSKDYDHIGDKK